MGDPIVFISHFRVKDGHAPDHVALIRETTPRLEADKPATLVFLAFADEDRSEVGIVHVFGDAEAVDRHFEGAGERSQAAYEHVEPLGWELYGTPSRGALDVLRNAAAMAGVELRHLPRFEAGFLRVREPAAVR